jgi:hypothetical protein
LSLSILRLEPLWIGLGGKRVELMMIGLTSNITFIFYFKKKLIVYLGCTFKDISITYGLRPFAPFEYILLIKRKKGYFDYFKKNKRSTMKKNLWAGFCL